MASSAQTLITSAIGLGYDALSDRDLKECLLYAAQTGGGGGGTTQVYQGNGAPVAAPTTASSPAIYTDLNNGTIYTWNVNTQAWF